MGVSWMVCMHLTVAATKKPDPLSGSRALPGAEAGQASAEFNVGLGRITASTFFSSGR